MTSPYYPMPRADARRVWAGELLGSLGIVAVLYLAGKVAGR